MCALLIIPGNKAGSHIFKGFLSFKEKMSTRWDTIGKHQAASPPRKGPWGKRTAKCGGDAGRRQAGPGSAREACVPPRETDRSEHSIVHSWTLHLVPSADLLKQSSQKPLSLAILSACSLHSTDYIYKCLFLLTQLQVRATLSIQLKQTSFTSPIHQFPLLVTVHLILYMGLLRCSSPTL